MGIFEKLKNALFEEEYVEVVEKPKTKKVSKKKPVSKEVVKEKHDEDYEDEKPVAKKVVLPEKKEPVIPENIDLDEDFEDEEKEIQEKPRSTFKMIDDDDLVDEPVYPTSEPKIVKVIEKEEKTPIYSSSRDEKLYPSKPVKTGPMPYGIEETPKSTVHEYNIYEKKEEKSYFKPSPIISPIYGILDKNYRKEDVVPKREVRFTSSLAKERVSVDDVRAKAFGNNEEEIGLSKKNDVEPSFEVENDTNLLVDLSSDDDKPAVKDVTMGDALEYFQDLGLEYNVDYVDAGKKNTTPKREKEVYADDIAADNFEVNDVKEEPVIKKEKTSDPVDTDDNLFDLIDSMYQDQE